MGFLTREKLNELGLKKFGENVLISDKASIYGASKIEIGSRVRIDDFCVLSAGDGGISIGNNVHVAVYSSVIGAGKVILEDFVNISSRVSIYSSNDDYSGRSMTNPTVPECFKKVTVEPVTIRRHSIIGSGTVVLPGLEVGEGSAVGALSLVKKDLAPWGVYSGVPAKYISRRSEELLCAEVEYCKQVFDE
jgi:galactoside O-acetyltransferase